MKITKKMKKEITQRAIGLSRNLHNIIFRYQQKKFKIFGYDWRKFCSLLCFLLLILILRVKCKMEYISGNIKMFHIFAKNCSPPDKFFNDITIIFHLKFNSVYYSKICECLFELGLVHFPTESIFLNDPIDFGWCWPMRRPNGIFIHWLLHVRKLQVCGPRCLWQVLFWNSR